MATLKAPFNFVPLPRKVFFPGWANQISQDIPFKDGVSGIIHLKITAKNPIFIRNGHTRDDHDNQTDTYKSFSKSPDGRFFIPATSLKGCIRSVLEIMSFGKMTQVKDESFGIRDLSTGPDGNFYRDKIKPANIHCGWMKETDGGDYSLLDCGLPWRISDEELDSKYGCGLVDFVTKGNFKEDQTRTAFYKYDLCKDLPAEGKFSPDYDLRSKLKAGDRQFVKYDPEGKAGEVVFTGQPGNRQESHKKVSDGHFKMEGKFYEFVFPIVQGMWKKIPEEVVDTFISIHQNSVDYKDFRKKQLDQGKRIPVFFMYDEKGEVDSIGLAYMYRYPAYNSVKFNGIPKELLSPQPDLAECIFGYTTKACSLKGRVHFGNAFALSAAELPEQTLILSTPHPSYYPLYLGSGQTWNSKDVTIAGRKRYPVRNQLENNQGTADMEAKMRPLDKGTVFEGEVRFFNLKPEELGALLAAITFDNHAECFHNVGAGKPLGYGKVKIDCDYPDKEQYISDFENLLFEKLQVRLRDEVSMQELFAMAKGIPEGRDSEFTYMKMDMDRSRNQFLQGKKAYKDGEQLGLFTQILNHSVSRSVYQGNVPANASRPNRDSLKELENQKKKIKFENLSKECKQLFAQEKYDQVIDLATEIGTLDVTFFDSELDQVINQAKRILEERQRGKIQEEKLKATQFENESKRLHDLALGYHTWINELCSSDSFKAGEYKVDKFKTLDGKTNSWLKKKGQTELDAQEKDDFEEAVYRLAAKPDKKEKKGWTNENSFIWKECRRFLGTDRANRLFLNILKLFK